MQGVGILLLCASYLTTGMVSTAGDLFCSNTCLHPAWCSSVVSFHMLGAASHACTAAMMLEILAWTLCRDLPAGPGRVACVAMEVRWSVPCMP
jgi:hypothetical protein